MIRTTWLPAFSRIRVTPRSAGVATLALLALAAPATGWAQDRPFIFSITTATDTSKRQVLFSYDIAAGEQAFRSNDTGNGPEQRFVAQATLGRWTLLGHAGLSTSGGSTRGWQQGEVLYSVLQQQSAGLSLAVGGGLLHEAGGVNVLVARAAAGRDFAAWRLHGNMVMQAPLSGDRDEVDVMTSLGWSRRIARSVSLGVEAIGEDLEGFWEAEEAEGGARLMVGPSLHVAPPGRRWQLSVAGGPVFHPSDTARSSDALRDLPSGTDRVGYAVRTSFACGF